MTVTTTIDKHETRVRGGKYLTFALGCEEYGLEILKASAKSSPTCGHHCGSAHADAYVKGVINLRGQVISVIDLRSRFGMPAAERTEQTCIIVVEIKADVRRVLMGILVDRVSEVLNIPEQQIEDAPSFGTKIDTSFILGMGKTGATVKILLDADRVLGAKEIEDLAANHGTRTI